MSHYPPPATHAEWVQAIEDGAYPTYDLRPGHHMLIAEPGRIQVDCTCGWIGPDRTDDDPSALLAVDDADWHMERVAADARAAANTLALGRARGWDR